METKFTYKIKDTYHPSLPLYVAANAIVCKRINFLEYLEENLPNVVVVKAIHATTIPPFIQSYFKTLVIGPYFNDRIYNGWCVDLDSNMIDHEYFCASVYSSYEPLPDGIIEKPENLDLVNYVLNQRHIGKPSNCGGSYTFGDVQRAIWELIEDHQSDTAYLGPWNQCRVDEIIADAYAYGEGFVPSPGQTTAIILKPTNKLDGQISIIELTIHCEFGRVSRNAWGAGLEFPGNMWATYFRINPGVYHNYI
jgi:hypothetical protein